MANLDIQYRAREVLKELRREFLKAFALPEDAGVAFSFDLEQWLLVATDDEVEQRIEDFRRMTEEYRTMPWVNY
jgi:hypothetical protein